MLLKTYMSRCRASEHTQNVIFKLDDMRQIGEIELGKICAHVQIVRTTTYRDGRADGAKRKNSSPAFVAVVTERKIYVFALRVTQQRMWTASVPTRTTRYAVPSDSTKSHLLHRCNKLMSFVQKIVMQSARDFRKVRKF
jgi:hypothetical protein